MNCIVCGKKTHINWGTSSIVLCEKHSHMLGEIKVGKTPIKQSSNATLLYSFVSKIILIIFFGGFTFLLSVSAVLSGMGFATGFSWTALSVSLIFWLLPVFTGLFTLYLIYLTFVKKVNI